MSTITASYWVVAQQTTKSSGRIKNDYLHRLLVTRITKTSTIKNARAFKTEEEARKVLDILKSRFWGKWIIQEVTNDLITLNDIGLVYPDRYTIINQIK